MALHIPNTDAHTQELTERIAWIIRLRWIAAAGVTFTIWLVPRVFGVDLAQRPLYIITAGLALYNGALWAVSRWAPRATQGFPLLFANSQITLDLVFLTSLVHYSGGIENPFICYFVFHVVIASILLSRRATYLQAGLALSLLLTMAALQASGVLPHYHLVGLTRDELYRSPVYVFAALFALGTMLFFAAFMATSITARLREREAEILHLSASLAKQSNDLRQAYSSLQGLEREKSDYLHRVAHDLRSPLATVERMLAVTLEGRTGQIPDKARQMLDRARRRVRHLLDLARDMLALSRAREAHQRAFTQQVDLGAVLADLEDDLRQRAASAEVRLTTLPAPVTPSVLGDPESLAELIENLVSNAVKYTPPGGEVRVELRREGDAIAICVTDSGIGIPAEEQDLIFGEFYRGSNARETSSEGTGLGLSIVRAIAEAHRGTVSVESQVGSGSVFKVLIPAASSDSGEPPPTCPEEPNSSRAGRADHPA